VSYSKEAGNPAFFIATFPKTPVALRSFVVTIYKCAKL